MSEERPFDTPSGVAAYDALARNGTAVHVDDGQAAPIQSKKTVEGDVVVSASRYGIQPGQSYTLEVNGQEGSFTFRGVVPEIDAAADTATFRLRQDADGVALKERLDGCYRTITRQRDLLTGVVNAIKGPPPELVRWSHHDAPQLAAQVVRERDEARAEVERLRRERDDATPPAEAGPR